MILVPLVSLDAGIARIALSVLCVSLATTLTQQIVIYAQIHATLAPVQLFVFLVGKDSIFLPLLACIVKILSLTANHVSLTHSA